MNAITGNTNRLRQSVLAETDLAQELLFEDLSRMGIGKLVGASLCDGGAGLVVVGDLDIGSISVAPDETKAPLVVYSDAHLSGSISGQHFKPVSWWIAQIIHRSRGIELAELA